MLHWRFNINDKKKKSIEMSVIPEKRVQQLIAVTQTVEGQKHGLRFTPDAVAHVAIAAEVFLQNLMKEAVEDTEKSKKKTIQMVNLFNVMQGAEYEFAKELIDA
eukprot:PhF_6_TR16998/c0_g1_i2/m.25726/K03506/POLE4; DNA polymerase epsilon subunit 4